MPHPRGGIHAGDRTRVQPARCPIIFGWLLRIAPAAPLIKMRDGLLAAELQEVRQHRDDAIAERELLAARILKLMTPASISNTPPLPVMT